jgi:tetratricopeptide (TPR) repeat protein
MGYEPHWQDIEPTDGGEMLAVLRRWIEPSSLVIQLVGQRYGAEPPVPTTEFGRVSYTQFEALFAEKAGKKVIYHFIEPGFPTDVTLAEPEDLKQLQAKYRERLVAANKLRHGNIASAADLELSVRRLRDELASLRAHGERRFRKMFALAAASMAGLAMTAGLVLWNLHQQNKMRELVITSSAQTADQLAAYRTEAHEWSRAKSLAEGQTQPPLPPPELIEKAKFLLERGNAEDQALAKIVLKQHEEADRIIQDLKSKPGNPIDETVRLLTMEGNNWYQAGQPDRAIKPYELALDLRPENLSARNNVAAAHSYARLGDIAAHRQRSIEVAEGTLKLASPASVSWAAAQNNLGDAWLYMPTGERGENLRKAIAAYEAALTVYTKDAHRDDWARIQNDLGIAWRNMPTGDRSENLRKAIAAYEAALIVYTKDADRNDWAMIQNNLGIAWSNMPTGDRSENLGKAISAYQAALAVRRKDSDPADWARTQHNLGNAWLKLPTGDWSENLGKAISALEAALTVRTKDTDPAGWARTHYVMGIALADMAKLPGSDRLAFLARAIASGKAALTVYTAKDFPRDHESTLKNLEIDRRDYEAAGGAEKKPFGEIEPAK